MNFRPVNMYSSALRARRSYYVCLPASYEHTDKTYPVVYLLHGFTNTEMDWIYRGHAVQTAERLIQQGEIPECIVISPNDGGHERGTFYTNWYDGSGRFEDYFLYDVIAHVEANFRTIAERSSRFIGGFSMGGYGAVMLALRNPDWFAAAASISGALGPATGYPDWMRASILGPLGGPHAQGYDLSLLAKQAITDAESPRPELYMVCGTEDDLLAANQGFHEVLERLDYAHQYKEVSGAHKWEFAGEQLHDVLRFFAGINS